MNIVIGSDHRGFELKERLKVQLAADGFVVDDQGAYVYDDNDDYPDYALKVAQKIQKHPTDRGILICGSGVGVDVVANKVDGVRAGLGLNEDQVISARRDDDINILVLAADYINIKTAERIVSAFIQTEFSHDTRFAKRLDKITEIEKTN